MAHTVCTYVDATHFVCAPTIWSRYLDSNACMCNAIYHLHVRVTYNTTKHKKKARHHIVVPHNGEQKLGTNRTLRPRPTLPACRPTRTPRNIFRKKRTAENTNNTHTHAVDKQYFTPIIKRVPSPPPSPAPPPLQHPGNGGAAQRSISSKLACKMPSGGTSVMAFTGLEERPPLYRGCQFSCRTKT